MAKRRRERKPAQPPPEPASRSRSERPEPFIATRWTAVFGGTGIATVLLGFLLLYQEWLTLAPVLLVVGFLVLIPLALVK